MVRFFVPPIGRLVMFGVGTAMGGEPVPAGAVASLKGKVGGKHRLLDALHFPPSSPRAAPTVLSCATLPSCFSLHHLRPELLTPALVAQL